MPYCPPNVRTQTLGPGTHQVVLTGFKEITDPAKLAKFQAQVVYIATCKGLDTGGEIDLIIKFTGSKADFYAGQNVDRLFMVAGLPAPADNEPLDISALLVQADGQAFILEVNDKGYAQDVIVPSAATGTDEAF